jgi:hypothetical protein
MKLSKEPQCQNVSKKFKWFVPTAHRHVVNSSPTLTMVPNVPRLVAACCSGSKRNVAKRS